MARYDTEELLGMVRSRAMIPTDSPMHPTSRLLAMADDVVSLYLVPLLLRTREEHLNARVDMALVADSAAYRVPTLAMGGALRNAWLVDRDGGLLPLVRVEPESLPVLRPRDRGTPSAFHMDGNSLVLLPAPDTTAVANYRLRLVYHRQPNRLVEPSKAAVATGLVAEVPAGTELATAEAALWAIPGTLVDVVQGAPPFDTLAEGVAVVSASPTALTVAALVPDIRAGDYVCPTGYAPVLQVPASLHALVALKVAESVARSSGDEELARGLERERAEAEAGAVVVVTPRTPGHSRRVPNGMAKWRGRSGY